MRLFGYDKFKKIYEVYKIPEGEDIQDKSVAKQIRRAQKDKEIIISVSEKIYWIMMR